jgi:cytochrome b561
MIPSTRSGHPGYSVAMQAMHWTTVALMISTCVAIWMVDAVGSKQEAAWLVMLHRSLGVTIMLLTPVRLAVRRRARIPALPAGVPVMQRAAARASARLLYGLLMLQPLLGLAASLFHGDRVVLFGSIELPAWLPANKALAHQLFQLHGWSAVLLLTLIGLHAAAALYHHFVRRDGVLAGMLPGVRPLSVASSRALS